GETLHDEALAAEESGAQLLLEEHRQLHGGLRRQEAALLENDFPARGDGEGADTAGEAGGKGNHAGAALGGVAVLEQSLAGKHPAQCVAQAAAGGGLRVHVGAHPAHAAPLSDHGLAAAELTDDDREGSSLNGIFHTMRSSLLIDQGHTTCSIQGEKFFVDRILEFLTRIGKNLTLRPSSCQTGETCYTETKYASMG